jgi:hypothetical protein
MMSNLKERLADMSALSQSRTPADALKYIEELEAKLAKAVDSEVIKAQQLFNYYAVEVATYGATAARLTNLENAWINLLTQTELEELKGKK